MDGCMPDNGRLTIRSAGRNRIRVPKSILSRIPHGKTSADDENRIFAEGDTDGIERSQAPETCKTDRSLAKTFRKSSAAGLGPLLVAGPALFFKRYFCLNSIFGPLRIAYPSLNAHFPLTRATKTL
jgi:hypothetical protein